MMKIIGQIMLGVGTVMVVLFAVLNDLDVVFGVSYENMGLLIQILAGIGFPLAGIGVYLIIRGNKLKKAS
jgi:hypothetical protein